MECNSLEFTQVQFWSNPDTWVSPFYATVYFVLYAQIQWNCDASGIRLDLIFVAKEGKENTTFIQ